MNGRAESSLFDLNRILDESFVEQIEFHPELESTNDLALELSRTADFRTPLLVLTDRQTAGRGRGSNRWWAAEGALTFSVVLNVPQLELPAERLPQLSLVTGVAVCRALEQVAPAGSLAVKWPNDVMLNAAKVCGILMEVVPGGRARLVAGIGINVNNSFRDAPADVRRIGTSLFDVIGSTQDVTDILIQVLRYLHDEYIGLSNRDKHQHERWRERSFLTGRQIVLRSGDAVVRGRCEGIAEDGAILIRTSTGTHRSYSGVIESIG